MTFFITVLKSLFLFTVISFSPRSVGCLDVISTGHSTASVYHLSSMVQDVIIFRGSEKSTTADGYQTKIIGGDRVTKGQYPYMVHIRITPTDFLEPTTYECSGFIISRNLVITAAHCLYEKAASFFGAIKYKRFKSSIFKVKAGVVDLKDRSTSQIVKVKRSCIHPKYKVGNGQDYDIAILQLKVNLKYNKFVQNISIGNPDDNKFFAVQASTHGWGDEEQDSIRDARFLGTAQVNLTKLSDCMDTYSKIPVDKKDIPTKRHRCALGPESQTICNGDSGGPLVCFKKGSNVEVACGVASYNSKCDRKNVPGVYVNTFNKDIREYILRFVQSPGDVNICD